MCWSDMSDHIQKLYFALQHLATQVSYTHTFFSVNTSLFYSYVCNNVYGSLFFFPAKLAKA